MDEYWRAAARFLSEHGLGGEVVAAPTELGQIADIGFSYANLSPSDAGRIKALVLHKGRYRELNRRFLRLALERLTPGFANEVFIVLSLEEPQCDPSDPHLAALDSISTWANAEEAASTPAPDVARERMSAVYLGDKRILVETIFGHLMVVPSDDRSITPHLVRDGYFDLGLTRFIRRWLRPGMTFVDVGANVGAYALIGCAGVGEKGRVLAVEANPALAEMLQDNFAMNGFESWSRVLRIAASDADGEATMYVFARRRGASTFAHDVAMQAVADYSERLTEISVEARRLDTLLGASGMDRADLVKIDVEGFELNVLRGAMRFLSSAKPALMMEWHPKFMSPETAESTWRLLTDDLSYSVGRIGGDGEVSPATFADLMSLEHADILAEAL